MAFAFIHIRQVIHLKKLQFFHVFFPPKLHLFFCRIIAINKMLCLDELWYCQPVLLQIEVKEKIIKNENNFSFWILSIKHQSQALT